VKAFLLALVMALFAAGAAFAQNLSLRAPEWAAPMAAADTLATTGGRAALAGLGREVAVRVTIAPVAGGVARVVRYEAGGANAQIFLRRFTGHQSAGWWAWGPETPTLVEVTPAQRSEIDRLARAALADQSGETGGACTDGERAFVELAVAARTIVSTRSCVRADPISALVRRLSDVAGSRTEAELHATAEAELLAADRAFNDLSARSGPAAAFGAYAAENAMMFVDGRAPIVGREAIAQFWAGLARGATLTWVPERARVADRGDMGWTWGRGTFTGARGEKSYSLYVTIWTRDFTGAWKFAGDLGVDAPAPEAAR